MKTKYFLLFVILFLGVVGVRRPAEAGPVTYYGMVWPDGPEQFPQLKDWGINVVWMNIGFNRSEWERVYEAAIDNGIKINAILWGGADAIWCTNFEQGRPFLNWLRDNPRYLQQTFAVYESNEPWMTSYTSPNELRNIYQSIKSVVPSLKVYCAGCADHSDYVAPGMYDYTHAGAFPFSQAGTDYDWARRNLAEFYHSLTTTPGMEEVRIVIKGQTFRGVAPWDRMPTADEMRELADVYFATEAIQQGKVAAFVWYPWRGGPYYDYLANHPELWSVVKEVYDKYFAGVSTPTPTPPITSTPTPPPSPTPTPSFKNPDLDGDEDVDIQDLKILLDNWGNSPSEPRADLSGDGKVNGIDFEMIKEALQ